ncbi:MAG TPA: hypothetical protein VKQ34_01970 [Candidatus Saccharimonadales bacterium]|nr:hypothetical protein [Candidatus Saccharimonadales bacterium]
MQSSATDSDTRLFLRALAPSWGGLVGYVFVALAIIGLHVLNISLAGAVYPSGFNDSMLQWYAGNVIGPLGRLLTNGTFNTLLSVILWAFIGWLLYEGFAYAAQTIHDWRAARNDIMRNREFVVVRHPLERTLVLRMAWRLFIATVFIAFTLGIQPVVRHCIMSDDQLMSVTHIATAVRISSVTIALWILLFHGYVVLLRLYLLRTRVFGEILY